MKRTRTMLWTMQVEGHHLLHERTPPNRASLCGRVIRNTKRSFRWNAWIDRGPITFIEGRAETLEAAKFNVEACLRVLGKAKL